MRQPQGLLNSGRRGQLRTAAPWLALAAGLSGILRAESARADVLPISNGEKATECAFPSVVYFSGGCTGLLVHPKLVLYAAHCGGKNAIYFGEQSNGPSVSITQALVNPEYDITIDNGNGDVGDDWAFGVLSREVTEVPVTPVAYGCELEQLIQVGQEIVQCGFGDPNQGVKFWKKNAIRLITEGVITTDFGGVACPGDSGGPLLARLPDGSWRTIGITSTLIPDPPVCGGSMAYNDYSRVRPEMIAWVESESGIDITPCHDADGTWNPGPDCGGFFAGDTTGVGSWDDDCEGTPVVEKSMTCGTGGAGGVGGMGGAGAGGAAAGMGGDGGGGLGGSGGSAGSAGVGGMGGTSGASGSAGLGGGGGAGTGGAGGSAGAGGGAGAGAAGVGGTSGAGAGGQGVGGTTTYVDPGPDGCGCRVGASDPSSRVSRALLLAFAALGSVVRRRRQGSASLPRSR